MLEVDLRLGLLTPLSIIFHFTIAAEENPLQYKHYSLEFGNFALWKTFIKKSDIILTVLKDVDLWHCEGCIEKRIRSGKV